MQLAWTQGLTPEEAEEFKALLLNNTRFSKQFLRILSSKYESIEKKGFREEDYQNTDWTHLQAFNNGRMSAIKDIAEMFNFRPESPVTNV